jgi:IS30 family transposase
MSKTYNHLSLEDRAVMQVMLDHRCSLRAIARKLQRSASTISRELARSGGAVTDPLAAPSPGRPRTACGYRCAKAHQRAQRLARKARVARKMVHGNALWTRVIDALRGGLSPEQASGILQRMPDAVHISHETIYTALYAMPRGELRRQILELLPRGHKSRRPRGAGTDRRGLIPGAISIDDRPVDVNERLVPGHWEGDLIKGARNQSQIGTLVERKTLFTVLVALDNATAEHTAQRFGLVLNRLDTAMRLSMTYDNGREMAHHQALSKATGIKVYFAHPYSPWERGINENTNGLLRRTLPKGTDLSVHSQADLDAIALHHNAKPRKSLGWKSPAELFLPPGSFNFHAYWATIIKPVALGA